jgi:methylated-DNA-[protein]-cysteine S-methyltransferase
MTPVLSFTTTPSPLGSLLVLAEDDALAGVYFENAPISVTPRPEWVRDDRRLRAATAQLAEYFAGRRTAFDLPLAPHGTPFQRAVWEQLLLIPYGETRTYGELARALGKPAAQRAVGGANHENPISIIVPCHRVIGADGSLTGYGGHVDRKRQLLDLEARVAAERSGRLVPGGLPRPVRAAADLVPSAPAAVSRRA